MHSRSSMTVAMTALLAAASAAAASAESFARVAGARPPVMASSLIVGAEAAEAPVSLAITLPWRNQVQLDVLLKHMYTPSDPLFHRYLTTDQFIARFAPTEADYNYIASWAVSQGLQVTGTSRNRHVLKVAGSAALFERALNVRLAQFVSPAGDRFRAPLDEPVVPASVASRVLGFSGLSTAAKLTSHLVKDVPSLSPRAIGTGPKKGLSPSDIRAAYGMTAVGEKGDGQKIAIFELDTYDPADINAYTDYFGLSRANLTSISVDGGPVPGSSGQDEATLDVELAIALAPSAAAIITYEAKNSEAGVIDGYNRIAADNSAQQVSTSWGLAEQTASASMVASENQTFKQMAAQGQSLYSASGDSGAYDNGSTLSVDDPASQPYVIGVGGTTLTTLAAGGAYASEKVWNSGSIRNGGSGGGISKIWNLPSYQVGVAGVTTSKRNVPDVAIDGDPQTGYAIYYKGGWVVFGGTSCGSPLWTGFNALLNQRRASKGAGSIGFASPSYYKVYSSSDYALGFHDITAGDNLYYSAAAGYDPATGIGSMNGAALLQILETDTSGTSPSAPSVPANVRAVPGNGVVTLSWDAVTSAASYTVYRRQSGAATFTILGTVTAASYADHSVVNGVAYDYAVSATNTGGTSALSAPVTTTPTAPATSVTFAAGLNFLSLPYNYPADTTLDGLFGYAGVKLAVYSPTSGEYVLTPTAPANMVTPGRGYWVRLPKSISVPSATPPSTAANFNVVLGAGWNQIGDPFPTGIPVSSLSVINGGVTSTWASAVQNNLVGSLLYSYNSALNAYVPVEASDTLVPNKGYWVRAMAAETLIFPHL